MTRADDTGLAWPRKANTRNVTRMRKQDLNELHTALARCLAPAARYEQTPEPRDNKGILHSRRSEDLSQVK